MVVLVEVQVLGIDHQEEVDIQEEVEMGQNQEVAAVDHIILESTNQTQFYQLPVQDL